MYKRVLIYISLLLFFVIPAVFSQESISNPNIVTVEEIKNFDTQYRINRDGTVSVTEYIEYNFDSNKKHGILREIPLVKVNEKNEKFRLTITDISVMDRKDISYLFTTSEANNTLSLKIGDPNKFVDGVKNYVIKYTVSGAITYYDNHDEFYWNVTGNLNDIKILNSSVLLAMPALSDSDKGITDVICYTGLSDSKDTNCDITKNKSSMLVRSAKPFNKGEGLTFAVKFDKGIVSVLEPKKIGMFSDIKSLPLFVLVMLGLVLAFWYLFLPVLLLIPWVKEKIRIKRDARILPAWFEPPNDLLKNPMRPALVGTLVGKNDLNSLVSSTLVYLAQKGYLKIEIDSKNNISLTKIKEFMTDTSLMDFEVTLLKSIFGIHDGEIKTELSKLSGSKELYTSLLTFKKQLGLSINKNGIYETNKKSKLFWVLITLILAFMSFNVLLITVQIFVGFIFRRFTQIGLEKYSEARSLNNFLITQTQQLDFQANNQMFFEKLLPYATALGAEKIWIGKFREILTEAFEWYKGDDMSKFGYFNNSLNKAITSSRSHYSTYSSGSSSRGFHSGFSSSGRSGGGGGGGRTSSW